MKKKLITLILAAMSITALAACGGKKEPTPGPGPEPGPTEELPAEYDLLKHWKGNSQEESYKVTESDSQTVIKYTDVTGEYAGGWEFVARSFAYDTRASEFGVYKKVSFTGKLAVTEGTNIVMVKVEGKDGNQWERKFEFNSEVNTYEFGLSFVSDWSKVEQMLFFVNRESNESGSGTITLTKMVLSKEEVNTAYDIAPNMPSIPQGYGLYNGGVESFDVMFHWGYDVNEQIVTEAKDGGYKFTWTNKTAEWAYVSSKVKNSQAQLQESGFIRLAFTVVGKVGNFAIFKLEGENTHVNVEKRVEFTGEEQLVELAIENVIKTADETAWMALIFCDGGAANTSGELTLKSCKLDKVELQPEVNPQAYNIYESGETFKVMTDWRANATKDIVVEPTAAGYDMSWFSKASEWDNAFALFKLAENADATNFNAAKFTVNGLAGRTMLAKIELHNAAGANVGAKEKSLEFNGEDQELVVELADLFATPFVEAWFLIFPDQGTHGNADVEGTLTLKDVELYHAEDIVPPTPQAYNVFNGGDSFAVMTDWRANGESKVDVEAQEGGSFKLSWGAAKGDWENALALVKDGEAKLSESEFNRITFKVKGTAGREILGKVELHNAEGGQLGALEGRLVLDGTDQELVVNLKELLKTEAAEIWVLLFPDAGLHGVEDAEMLLNDVIIDKAEDVPPEPAKPTNVAVYNTIYLETTSFLPEEIGLEVKDHVATFSFNNLAADWGHNIQYLGQLHDDISWATIADYRHFHATFSASTKLSLLLKPFDNSSLERWVHLEANEEVTVDFDVEPEEATWNPEKPFVLFIDPMGAAPVSGTVTAKYMQMSRIGVNYYDGEKVDIKNYQKADCGAMQLSKNSDGQIVMDYTKEQPGWENIEILFTGHEVGLNKLEATITSTVATTILFKPWDNGALEKQFALVAGENKVSYIFEGPQDAMWGKLILFACINEGDALEGQLVFNSLTLSVAPEIAMPQGRFYGVASQTGGSIVPIDITFGETITGSIGQTALTATLKSFNKYTGEIVLETPAGNAAMTYNPVENKLEKFGIANNPLSFEYNYGIGVRGNYKLWDCNGTTEELQDQFNRRYGDPWSLDIYNADKVTSNAEHAISGTALRLRPYADNRFALAVKDFDQAYKATNLSFWVYNPGESAVTIQVFGYKATGYSSNFTIKGNTTLPAGQWTFVSGGCSGNSIYAFQIFVAKTSIGLIFDDIVLL